MTYNQTIFVPASFDTTDISVILADLAGRFLLEQMMS
jgi:hypothetical protein